MLWYLPPDQGEGHLLDVLLPPKYLGQSLCIILVTSADCSQFMLGHK